jgi:hypothetical protein
MTEYKKEAPNINFNQNAKVEDYLGLIIHVANEIIEESPIKNSTKDFCNHIIRYARRAWDLVPEEEKNDR